MNRIKKVLKKAYDIPLSKEKEAFLQRLNFPKSSYKDFFIYQISYIQKRVWILSTALIGLILMLLHFENITGDALKIIWITSSVLPFIALVAITEISRSMSHNMAEIEMSCRYNLADLMLARISILAAFNFILSNILILGIQGKTAYSPIRISLYIFVPFLLTCLASLIVLNYIKIKETTYICGGISCFISGINALIIGSNQIAYTDKFVGFWVIIFIALMVGIIVEIIDFIRKLEELHWNLQLTA
ncbi:hypothetical protein [Alkaliphilus peptidifermentans]|uniref:ABC-2 family transporter protein n=1 Tax=Alkaliphilus peptidifermentans DSM 18978 TaxID=1120976 RepID=A0A1G5IQX4_9FIRM|nr:hypothetical protein [Alkaliphilus peptidifermentans]SCY78482.1 hypothetical protein SAMN03080606_02473 [Alkaliphilus peptidifermentans DSM 18978]